MQIHIDITNMQRFFKHDFNDNKNCYWQHQDGGYNGIGDKHLELIYILRHG